MNFPRWTLLLFASVAITFAADKDESSKKPIEDAVFREPFTLKLHIDKEHFYEEKFDKIPFVCNGYVYLFRGDEFGLSVDVKDGSVRSVKYQPDVTKADVTLKFSQEIGTDGTVMMMLVIHNNTKYTLYMDGLMTVPNKKGVSKTTILPIRPGLGDYESWPHPIVQLALGNIRIKK